MATGSYEPIQPLPWDKQNPRPIYVVAAATAVYKKGNPASITAAGKLQIDGDNAATTKYIVASTVSATVDVTLVAAYPITKGQRWKGVLEGAVAQLNIGDNVGVDAVGAVFTQGSVLLTGAQNQFHVVAIDPRFVVGDTHAVLILEAL
jgi:hypothetical protein